MQKRTFVSLRYSWTTK